MAVNAEPDSKATAETKVDKVDWGCTTCFMSFEIEMDVPLVEELPSETTAEG